MYRILPFLIPNVLNATGVKPHFALVWYFGLVAEIGVFILPEHVCLVSCFYALWTGGIPPAPWPDCQVCLFGCVVGSAKSGLICFSSVYCVLDFNLADLNLTGTEINLVA